MIASFRHKGLEKLFHVGKSRYVAADLRLRVSRIMAVLDASSSIDDLDIPGFRLRELKGEMKGTYAIAVNGNWRISFRFADGKADDIDLVDYQ